MTQPSGITKDVPLGAPQARLPGVIARALHSRSVDDWSEVKRALVKSDDLEAQASLAFVALRSLPANFAVNVIAAASDGETAGQPIPPLLSIMDEAAFWADIAHPAELEAYCLMCFNRMKPHRQAEFLDFVQGRAAA